MRKARNQQGLGGYLWPDFKDIDGSVFLALEVPRRGVEFSQFHDRTEAEAFINHLHVLDLLEAPSPHAQRAR